MASLVSPPVLGPLLLAAAAGALAYVAGGSPAPERRTAISVSCADAPGCLLAEAFAVDVWSERRSADMPLDVVVTRAGLVGLRLAGVPYEVLVEDIDAVAAAEQARLQSPTLAAQADWFGEYRDYRAITERMIELARLAPERITMHGIGSSVEGRTIWALRIQGPAKPDGTRTKVLVDGTLHAREWIAAMTATCVADRVARADEADAAIRQFLDGTELWIVPVANPDGYQHSWTGSRYWRKNRRGDFGVDLNRNFGVAWGGSGSSNRPRSDVYRGEAAFSEPETAALRDLAKREGMALHVDLHSYGQMLLYPWNYSAAPAPDRDRLAALGDRMASGMFAAHGQRYKLLSGVELYPAAGTMTDWMYGEVGALSFTVELRPGTGRGLRGFVLPPEEIRPTCDEGLAALLALRTAVD